MDSLNWVSVKTKCHYNLNLNVCFICILKGTEICGYNRFRFLLQSLKDLESQFAQHGIHMMCFYGKPHEVLEKLIEVLLFILNCCSWLFIIFNFLGILFIFYSLCIM